MWTLVGECNTQQAANSNVIEEKREKENIELR